MNYTTETVKEVHTIGHTTPVKVVITWKQTDSVSTPVGIEVVSLNDDPITVKVVQALNLGAVMKEARRRNFSKPRVSSEQIEEYVINTQGKETSFDMLDTIASLYIEAYELGEPVQQYVANRIGRSVATTAKMIMKARSEGLIPKEANRRREPRVTTRVSQDV
jgi:hypothetical protein